MMHIYADADGHIIRVLRDATEAQVYGPPDQYAEEMEVDSATNPRLLAVLRGQLPGVSWQDIRLQGGVLTVAGVAETVNPPGARWQAEKDGSDAKRRILETIDATLGDYERALTHRDALTAAQRNDVLRRLVQVQVQLLRWHRRELL